jgi:hypothetical protein
MATTWKFITPEIESIAAGFGNHHLKQRIGLPKGPLYHYTTGDNLIKILASGELWSTQAACMNDSKELIYAVERLSERVRAWKDSAANAATDERLMPLWRALEDFISKPDAATAPIFFRLASRKKMMT